jgi:muramoyltetrapeptide carboxypeptidase LdcA involved in peptidoglycan recycling
MLLDPEIRAVVPPWGGDLAVEVLPHLDWELIARAEPTWLVGFSDISTLLLALTTRTGWASLHGQNLLDTPYRVPAPLRSWLDVVALDAGATVEQGAAEMHHGSGFVDYVAHAGVSEWVLDQPGGWRLLDPTADSLHARGRLLGGCVETVSTLAGSSYGDVPAFAAAHAPEGLLLYLEVSDDGAVDVARHLWRMRLAGWFDVATAVLMGRTHAPDVEPFTQEDAVRSGLADLHIPVILDVDCGHVPPHLALVNGALAEVIVDGDQASIIQTLPGARSSP